LYASRRLQFGPSASLNNELIWNSTMLAHGDTASCMNISGDNATFWQGTLVFGRGPLKTYPITGNPTHQTSYRVALHSEPWDGTDNQWQTVLADPNCVNLACAPQLETNILLGTISNDLGATYTQVFGNVMTFAFVDSVQNWDTDTSAVLHWSWSWPQDNPGEVAPFDDTLTIGFKACGKVVGVLNVPLLERFTIHRYAIISRNNVDIPGFYMGAMIDYDLPTRATQMNGYEAEHSLAWVYDCGALNNGWGFVKIPFGCRYTPLLMSKTIEARPGGPWNDSAWWLDSAYYWMSVQTGLYHQPNTNCQATTTDRDAWFSVAGGTIPANDSLVLAFANFGNPGITNADQASSYYAIADAANKWCGFGRGDVNNDRKVDLVDIVYLANYVRFSGNGPYPFKHLGDVDADGVVGDLDIAFLISYYFNFGECPRGAWTL